MQTSNFTYNTVALSSGHVFFDYEYDVDLRPYFWWVNQSKAEVIQLSHANTVFSWTMDWNWYDKIVTNVDLSSSSYLCHKNRKCKPSSVTSVTITKYSWLKMHLSYWQLPLAKTTVQQHATPFALLTTSICLWSWCPPCPPCPRRPGSPAWPRFHLRDHLCSVWLHRPQAPLVRLHQVSSVPAEESTWKRGGDLPMRCNIWRTSVFWLPKTAV